MAREKRKEAMHAAFEAAHYRPPTKKESDRINRAVDTRGMAGRPRKDGTRRDEEG